MPSSPFAAETVDQYFCQFLRQILPFSEKSNIDLWDSTPFSFYL